MKRARKLAETRNVIAHNPVMLDMYVKPQSEHEIETSEGEWPIDVDAEWTIRSMRNQQHIITIEELREFAAEVEDVASELWGAFLREAGTADHLWRVHESKN